MGLFERKFKETDLGESTRCGRCADLLPDETLTFCPACGATFSQYPPTNSYHAFHERALHRRMQFQKLRVATLTLTLFLGFICAFMLVSKLQNNFEVAHLHEGPRNIHFYFYDIEQFPILEKSAKREAIPIAIQAFEDHFGISIDHYEVHDNEIPASLSEILQSSVLSYEHGSLPNGEKNLATLRYWERNIFPKLTREWKLNPTEALPVFITNFPIFFEKDVPTNVETRHLSNSGVVAGLGHPSLVLVSTFRALSEDPEIKKYRPELVGEPDRAHYLGEYLLAHELGHALLGLADYITDAPIKNMPGLRAPASLESSSRPPAECLMHTDEGGGNLAWKALRRRHMGFASPCHEYDQALRAFSLRDRSIHLLKSGHAQEAEQMHREAIELSRNYLQPWTSDIWIKEHRLFVSLFRRWWNDFFVIQSKNDSP